jgi:ADP-ribose pyrophosphatase YjhB (NUDIX family)
MLDDPRTKAHQDRAQPRMPLPRHCPHCGGIVVPAAESTGACRRCGREVYANSRPAAGVFVVRGDRVLLVRRGAAPGEGKWDIPGGFLLEGEAPEAGAVREIREELGWELDPRELRLVLTSINPAPGGAVLDILFEAEAPAAEPRAGSDVAAFGWYPLHGLPEELAFDSSRRALERWRRSRRSAG